MYLDLYLLIVSIGMGSVYVIVYFATYIPTLEVHVYMYIQYLIPPTCTANFSFCSLQVR